MIILRHLLSLSLLFLTSILFGQSHYVGAGGEDISSAGSSPAAPYASLAYATGRLAPGDTLFILSGNYGNPTYGTRDFFKPQTDCTLYLNNVDGAAGQYITIKPYVKGGVVFQADGLSSVLVKNSSYIRVEGFEVYGETERIPLDSTLQYQFLYEDAAGDWQYRLPPFSTDEDVENAELVSLEGAGIKRPTYFNTSGIAVLTSHHIQVVDNIVHHMPGEGIRSFTSDYLWITDNEVYECSRRSATGVHGLSVYDAQSIDNNNGTKIWMLRNRVYQNYNEIYSWSTTKTFITPHIDEGKGITVQRCTADRSWANGRIRIENNISYRNGLSGIHLNSGERVDIYHNSLYNNSLSTELTGVGNKHGISAQSSDDLKIINNIVVADVSLSSTFAIHLSSNTTGAIIRKNMVIGEMNNLANDIDVSTNTQSPQYTDADGGDFSLPDGSPALDIGATSVNVTDDFFKNIRDPTPDLGAIEFQEALPIQLMEFTALAQGNKTVLLNWSTSAETNNDFFTVERSPTGENWNAIGLMLGSGTSSEVQTYRLTDQRPLSGTSFYRLRQTDLDGTSKLSSLRQVTLADDTIPFVFPNPARESITLSGLPKSSGTVTLHDALGRVVAQKQVVANNVQTEVSFDLRSLKPGIYFMQARGGRIGFVKL